MQQTDVVLRKACPRVSGRNCHTNQTTRLQARHMVKTCISRFISYLAEKHRLGEAGSPPPIYCNKSNWNSRWRRWRCCPAEIIQPWRAEPREPAASSAWPSGNGSVPNVVRLLLPLYFIPTDAGGPTTDGRVHHSHRSRGGALDFLFGHVRRLAVQTSSGMKPRLVNSQTLIFWP